MDFTQPQKVSKLLTGTCISAYLISFWLYTTPRYSLYAMLVCLSLPCFTLLFSTLPYATFCYPTLPFSTLGLPFRTLRYLFVPYRYPTVPYFCLLFCDAYCTCTCMCTVHVHCICTCTLWASRSEPTKVHDHSWHCSSVLTTAIIVVHV